MADEQNYKSYLLTFEEAMNNLWDTEGRVLSYVWAVFINTENKFQESQATQPSTTDNSSSQGMSSTVLHSCDAILSAFSLSR